MNRTGMNLAPSSRRLIGKSNSQGNRGAYTH
jgi:hypothetical protein